jgi:hypothetical protein
LAKVVGASDGRPATKGLPNTWEHADEWYEWQQDPSSDQGFEILLSVDEKSYGAGERKHPVAWCHEFDGGRAFYTALGHTREAYGEEDFRKHLAGGIEWAASHGGIATSEGLIVDLDADRGLTIEDGNRVARWENQAPLATARFFDKEDGGRAIAGSGRPLLRRSVEALAGHATLVFRESELVNSNEDLFHRLLTGNGYTWITVISPYVQKGRLPNVNSFLGNLQNGGMYEGIWAGFDDNGAIWMGSRNAVTFGRYDPNNPKVQGPILQRGQYYIVAGRMGAGQGAVPVELFVDSATPLASSSFPVNPQAKSSRLAIGQERDAIEHPGAESFDGEIARLLIYDRPLTTGELSSAIDALREVYFTRQSEWR